MGGHGGFSRADALPSSTQAGLPPSMGLGLRFPVANGANCFHFVALPPGSPTATRAKRKPVPPHREKRISYLGTAVMAPDGHPTMGFGRPSARGPRPPTGGRPDRPPRGGRTDQLIIVGKIVPPPPHHLPSMPNNPVTGPDEEGAP